MSEASSPAIPAKAAAFKHPMRALSGRLAGVGAIKVVAIGSSTTAGEGDIVPYPQRLETALRNRFNGRPFDVLNRGIGGEEAPIEVRRMQQDVIDERPSVVIWQVGTNAAWKGQDLDAVASSIAEGLRMIEQLGSDVILMDLQYVPALLVPGTQQAADRMVDLIAAAADRATFPVNVFQRYDLMRRWHEVERVSFDRIVDPGDDDRLHHSDWSVRQMVRALADTIVAAAAHTA
ncbi:SGNH/GDSL hydrolase family protein [Bradyrhizobium diazoefficiens]|nr:GDSL-type esterase/lipase family protein [Bradyrhizobium diazoefficiens]MBR0851553.1 SGNH/GDSL hydrolase family protein [Bradyrhizobium diazoefficiens]